MHGLKVVAIVPVMSLVLSVDKVPARLEAGCPGEEIGRAVAAVLFGKVNPSGKLPGAFPKKVADLPANPPARFTAGTFGRAPIK